MTQKTQASEVGPTSEVSFDDLDDRLPEEVAVIVLGVVEGGERLDKWLAGQLPDRSRAEVQRWIEAGLVTRGDAGAEGQLPGGRGRYDHR